MGAGNAGTCLRGVALSCRVSCRREECRNPCTSTTAARTGGSSIGTGCQVRVCPLADNWASCALYLGRLAAPAVPRLSTRCVANLGHLAWLALRMPHSSQKEGLNGPPSTLVTGYASYPCTISVRSRYKQSGESVPCRLIHRRFGRPFGPTHCTPGSCNGPSHSSRWSPSPDKLGKCP